LKANISKAKHILKWQPKVKFDELVKIMLDFDLQNCGIHSPGLGIKAIEKKGFDWTKHVVRGV